MKVFLRSVVLAVLTISGYAQTPRESGIDWSSKSRRAAEDTVASKIDAIRTSAKLPPLKRVNPSIEELELVCTAALTGRKVGDPIFADLQTYVTNDLSAETEPLKVVSLGTEACRGQSCSESKPRRPVYSRQKWPRYSVVVELSANSKPEHPEYTVGVARRPSAALEFFAPLFFDVPFKGINKWKEQVAPDCKNRKTETSR
jgi:hypothetical protein